MRTQEKPDTFMSADQFKTAILNSDSVRYLTKDIITQAWEKDPCDAVFDIHLALQVLQARVEQQTGGAKI